MKKNTTVRRRFVFLYLLLLDHILHADNTDNTKQRFKMKKSPMTASHQRGRHKETEERKRGNEVRYWDMKGKERPSWEKGKWKRADKREMSCTEVEWWNHHHRRCWTVLLEAGTRGSTMSHIWPTDAAVAILTDHLTPPAPHPPPSACVCMCGRVLSFRAH